MKKRIMSVLMTLILCCTLFPMSVISAADITYLVAGSAGLCNGQDWNTALEGNQNIMEYDADGTYSKTYTNVAAGSYELKVVEIDGSNARWYGTKGTSDGENIRIKVTDICDVTVTFDPATGMVTVEGDKIESPATEVSLILNDNSELTHSMDETSPGVWEMTLPLAGPGAVPTAIHTVKFNATVNGSTVSLGLMTGTMVESGQYYELVSDSDNVVVILETDSEVTFTVDMRGFTTSYTGAVLRVNVLSGVTTPEPTTYDLWVGGRRVTEDNADDVFSDGKVFYDHGTNTLFLNGATLTAAYPAGTTVEEVEGEVYGIFTETAALNLALSGTNTITVNDVGDAINVGGDLSISDGTLVGTGDSAGINSYGDLTISDSVISMDGQLSIPDGTLSIDSTSHVRSIGASADGTSYELGLLKLSENEDFTLVDEETTGEINGSYFEYLGKDHAIWEPNPDSVKAHTAACPDRCPIDTTDGYLYHSFVTENEDGSSSIDYCVACTYCGLTAYPLELGSPVTSELIPQLEEFGISYSYDYNNKTQTLTLDGSESTLPFNITALRRMKI